MLGGVRGQAWVGSVMRVRVTYRGLRAGGTSAGATRGAILRGRFMVSNRLFGGAASALAVCPGVGVKWPCGLLGALYNALRYLQVWRAYVGPRERPLVPGRLGAAIPCHEARLWPVISGLIPADHLLMVPWLSVSVGGRWRARAWSVPVELARFLATGLLLGPTLDSLIPLRRTGCTLTLAGVTSALVFWSRSVTVMSFWV